MEMGESGVDKSKRGVRRKNKVQGILGLHGTLWCVILCSSGVLLCVLKAADIAKLY